MGVDVVFAKAQGQVQFESSWTLPVLGLSDFTGLRTFVKTTTPINTIPTSTDSDTLSQICNFLMVTFLYQTNSNCNTCFFFLTSILLNLSATFNFPHRLLRGSW